MDSALCKLFILNGLEGFETNMVADKILYKLFFISIILKKEAFPYVVFTYKK